MRLVTGFVACLAVVFMAACSTSAVMDSQDNQYVETFQGIAPQASILLVPFASTQSPYQDGEAVVMPEIRSQLATGHNVSVLDMATFQREWPTAVHSVGGFYSPVTGRFDADRYHQAIRHFASNVNPNNDHDLIVFPALVEKQADSKGRYAYWDGVKRRHTNAGTVMTDPRWHGTTRGLSLELNTFTGAGDWLLTSYGGLLLPFYYEMDGSRPEVKRKPSMFDETDNIHSGVTVAIAPFMENVEAEPSR